MIGIQHDEQEQNYKNNTTQHENDIVTWLSAIRTLLNAQELNYG